MKSLAPFIVIAVISISCGSMRDSHKYQLGNGKYDFRHANEKYRKAVVYVKDDSIHIRSAANDGEVIKPNKTDVQYFLKRSFDVDVMTIAFKYRPSLPSLPRQLTTDFNGNVFLGYRLDRFKFKTRQTPLGPIQKSGHRAASIGVLGGIGSTAVTPWTTNNLMTDEYSGLILSRGAALLFGVNDLTVGFALGWDNLTDRDKDIWIYQERPWYGLAIALNLN